MYFYAKAKVSKVIYDQLNLCTGNKYLLDYLIESVIQDGFTSIGLSGVDEHGNIEVLIKAEKSFYEHTEFKDRLEKALGKVIDELRANSFTLNIFSRLKYVAVIEVQPTNKQTYSRIKRKFKSELKKSLRTGEELKRIDVVYSALIRRINSRNILRTTQLTSAKIVSEDSSKKDQAFNLLKWILRQNYFTKHILVELSTRNIREFIRSLEGGNIQSRIIIIERPDLLDKEYIEKIESAFSDNPYNNSIIMGCSRLDSYKKIKAHYMFKLESEKKVCSMNKSRLKEDLSSKSVSIRTEIDQSLKELDRMIGLNKVKQSLREIIIYNYIQKHIHKDDKPISNHFAFMGNPGTGKTTVARLLSQSLYAHDSAMNAKTIEVDRSQLVGKYIGHTAMKTKEVINKAKGGVLFVDEAYSLNRDSRDYGHEAISTLVKAMEDNRDTFSVVFAGYIDPMQEMLKMNIGLGGRINQKIIFENYSPDELFQILIKMSSEEGYSLEIALQEKILSYLISMEQINDPYFSNGRFVRNLFESLKMKYSLRIFNCNEKWSDLKKLQGCDLPDQFLHTKEDMIRKQKIGFIV